MIDLKNLCLQNITVRLKHHSVFDSRSKFFQLFDNILTVDKQRFFAGFVEQNLIKKAVHPFFNFIKFNLHLLLTDLQIGIFDVFLFAGNASIPDKLVEAKIKVVNFVVGRGDRNTRKTDGNFGNVRLISCPAIDIKLWQVIFVGIVIFQTRRFSQQLFLSGKRIIFHGQLVAIIKGERVRRFSFKI